MVSEKYYETKTHGRKLTAQCSFILLEIIFGLPLLNFSFYSALMQKYNKTKEKDFKSPNIFFWKAVCASFSSISGKLKHSNFYLPKLVQQHINSLLFTDVFILSISLVGFNTSACLHVL